MATSITVCLGSKSVHKVSAVFRALAVLGYDPTIIPVASSSLVNEQPEGLEETKRGANNRMLDAANVAPSGAWSLGIESCLMSLGVNVHLDVAVLALLSPSDEVFFGTSAGVLFDARDVEIARKASFKTTTVGHAMASRTGCDATDGTSWITRGKISRTDTLCESVRLLFAATIPNDVRGMHGVQFNGAWPTPNDLKVARLAFGWPRVVLQARGWSGGLNTACLVRDLRPYVGLATDVLLDASGGRGELLDVGLVARAVDVLKRADLGMGIGIAGGLCAETLPLIAPLLRERHDLSIDAEGRLRDDADGGGDLVTGWVDDYLEGAARVFGGAA